MCDAPIGTTSGSPAKKWNGSKKLTYFGGRGSIVTMVFLWSLSDSKSSQVSMTLLSILADLNKAVFPNPPVPVSILWWLYRGHQLLLVSPSLSCPIVFFFISLARSTYLSLFFLPLVLPSGQPEWQCPLFGRFYFFLFFSFFFFLLTITRSGRLAEIRSSVCFSKFQRILCVSFSRTDYCLWLYNLFVWSNFNFLHNSQWITIPTQSRVVWFFSSASLLHLLIDWLFRRYRHINYICYFVVSCLLHS